MNRFDIWLTNQPEEPPPICECGHGADDHINIDDGTMCTARTGRWSLCDCQEFSERPEEDPRYARQEAKSEAAYEGKYS